MLKKISIFILIVALIVVMMPVKSYASLFNTIIDTNNYIPDPPDVPDKVNDITNNILGLIYAIGVVLSVGTLMVIGIKFMTGSLEEKAQYKETLLPYLIGAVILFAGINILKFIYDMIQNTL